MKRTQGMRAFLQVRLELVDVGILFRASDRWATPSASHFPFGDRHLATSNDHVVVRLMLFVAVVPQLVAGWKFGGAVRALVRTHVDRATGSRNE
jgi:hypothetical protein